MYQGQKDNKIVVILIIIALIAVGNLVYQNLNGFKKDSIKVKTKSKVSSKSNTKTRQELISEPNKIFVHIGGAVIKPGVYQCSENSRLYKILRKAGGATNKADLNAINLANIVKDGQKIIIPSLTKKNSSSGSESKININTAQQDELEKIPGVGPVTAKKIVEFRKSNGQFEKITSLTNVSGIGPKTLEKIKKEITY